MAFDKVVDSAVLDTGLKQIADAIRAKAGTSDNLAFPTAMAEAIAAIEAGGGKMCFSTFTPSQNITPPYVFTHNLGVVPDFYLIWTKAISPGTNNLLRMSLICPEIDNTKTYLASLIYQLSTYDQQMGGVNGGYLVTNSISTPYNTLVGDATTSTFTYVAHSNYNGNIGLGSGVTYNVVAGRLLSE